MEMDGFFFVDRPSFWVNIFKKKRNISYSKDTEKKKPIRRERRKITQNTITAETAK